MFLKKKLIIYTNVFFNFIFFVFSNKILIIYYSHCFFFFIIGFLYGKMKNFLSFFRINYLYNLFNRLNKFIYYEIGLDGLYYRVKKYKKYHCLAFILGYNHYIIYNMPKMIKIKCHILRRKVMMYSYDNRIMLGNLAQEIVNLKYPNLFKGRGIKLVNFSYRKKIIKKKK